MIEDDEIVLMRAQAKVLVDKNLKTKKGKKALADYLKVHAPFVTINSFQDSKDYHKKFHIMVLNEQLNIVFEIEVKSLNDGTKTKKALNAGLLKSTNKNLDGIMRNKYYHTDYQGCVNQIRFEAAFSMLDFNLK